MDLIEIIGHMGVLIYRDEVSNYTVAKFKLYDITAKNITITGYLPIMHPDILFELSGTYLEHPRFGMQFQVSHYRRVLPTDRDSIISFLSSPIFAKIGRKFATSLVDTLGLDVLERLKQDLTLVRQVKGYTDAKEESLYLGLIQADEHEEALRFFTTHGLGIRNIMRLDRIYGSKVLDVVKENPYRLVEEVDGIGFKTADKLALSMGFELDDPRRLKAALITIVMDECMKNGDSYISYHTLTKRFNKEFSEMNADLDDYLLLCLKEHKLIQIDEKVFHPSQYSNEKYIAQYLSTFPLIPLDSVRPELILSEIKHLEDALGLHYDESQSLAILQFFNHPLSIVTGGPGTGKTTVVGAMLKLWRNLYPSLSVVCCAPTGRAAKRLFELTSVESSTIHSLIKWDLESNTFGKNELDPLNVDCLIIDEFSMVDTWLFGNLLKACAQVKKILIVGDKDQLPSVAPGKVLQDLIDSKCFPVSLLDRIYRQQEGSDVIELAHQIRHNTLDFTQITKDIKWIPCSAIEVKQVVLKIIEEGLQKGYAVGDMQVLAPMYSGQAGIDTLNHAVQKMVNPQSDTKSELQVGSVTYRVGDKILQLKNQPTDDVYNGDIGLCIEVILAKYDHNKQNRIVVDFDGRIVEYTSESFMNITLAYCISIHKSQGSEYPIVLLATLSEHKHMLQRRLVYTAVTRAAKSLILIGQPEAFQYAVDHYDEYPRNTCLVDYLVNKLE